MALIGNQIRQYSDRVVLDSLTASATADYTLQLNSTDFVPSSAESLTVSLNGIIQKPQDSYTVSGSTLTFDSALTASDSIDFIIAERGITLQTPSAGSVNTEQLANNAVTYAKSTGFGKVGQVVNVSKNDAESTSSSSYVDITGMSASITPSSTSSKILVSMNCSIIGSPDSSLNYFRVLRGTSTITDLTNDQGGHADTEGALMTVGGANYTNSNRQVDSLNFSYLDSPASTSAQTYKLQFKANPSDTVYFNKWSIDNNKSGVATITLMEILN